ncbi:hypothetical protein VOLCADRAFT_91775 [Volvox carteri f. nagariensis]|uniref:Uncharacterized protein n=1 Tax=Volvox carteri f. nagariensis TaxID=3068 RepID=D8TXX5_VOLCA|nr:uncharacterized protein VOLCADRAFT_91775 [Volvox carteri f. nagariensis]EFJ47798.1 hypothetical protein VOLCADRAFT_91775 [Volvox carteri f. nagariensis]|eukprot:XP_002951269.1 hypothetical protein VOLCADRAFT_91775 [Volvox carteri f. nagariensis]
MLLLILPFLRLIATAQLPERMRESLAFHAANLHPIRNSQNELVKRGSELERFFSPSPSSAQRAVHQAGRPSCYGGSSRVSVLGPRPRGVSEFLQRPRGTAECVPPTSPQRSMAKCSMVLAIKRGSDWHRVADEQQRYATLRSQVEEAAVALQDAVYAAAEQLESREREKGRLDPGKSVAFVAAPNSNLPRLLAQLLNKPAGDEPLEEAGAAAAAAAAADSPQQRGHGSRSWISGLFICARIRRPQALIDLPPVRGDATAADFTAAAAAAKSSNVDPPSPSTGRGGVEIDVGADSGGDSGSATAVAAAGLKQLEPLPSALLGRGPPGGVPMPSTRLGGAPLTTALGGGDDAGTPAAAAAADSPGAAGGGGGGGCGVYNSDCNNPTAHLPEVHEYRPLPDPREPAAPLSSPSYRPLWTHVAAAATAPGGPVSGGPHPQGAACWEVKDPLLAHVHVRGSLYHGGCGAGGGEGSVGGTQGVAYGNSAAAASAAAAAAGVGRSLSSLGSSRRYGGGGGNCGGGGGGSIYAASAARAGGGASGGYHDHERLGYSCPTSPQIRGGCGGGAVSPLPRGMGRPVCDDAGAGGTAGTSVPGVLYRSMAPDLWTHDPWDLLETYRSAVGRYVIQSCSTVSGFTFFE